MTGQISLERVVLVQPPTWTEDGIANFGAILGIADRSRQSFGPHDIFVLPELAGAELDEAKYVDCVRRIARSLGVWVVGGSHHRREASRVVNCGVACAPDGAIAATYEKLNPYGVEAHLGINKGSSIGALEIGGRRVVVMLCADLWHSQSFASVGRPDVLLVPSFSITQWPSPQPARTLWRHMAVSRAYEFATFVGISDWSAASEYEGQRASGAGGWATPCPETGSAFFQPMSRRRLSAHIIDFDRLGRFREDRRRRAFLGD